MTAVSNIEVSADSNNVNSNEYESRVKNTFMRNFEYSLIFIFAFVVFLMNFIAVSISLQCNKDKGHMVKISSALFAFMFGFLYILINYFMYRVNLKSNACIICSDNPFPF
tara:strand:- start:247 stop:576 length:330 start_codon:yes stop_codon:yes gene_type:complete